MKQNYENAKKIILDTYLKLKLTYFLFNAKINEFFFN